MNHDADRPTAPTAPPSDQHRPASGGAIPDDYPPFLYIPCMEHVTDGAQARAQYRRTQDGRWALLVYSALDRLHACCGKEQPWFGLPTHHLQLLYDVHPFDVVYTDMYVPEERRGEVPA